MRFLLRASQLVLSTRPRNALAPTRPMPITDKHLFFVGSAELACLATPWNDAGGRHHSVVDCLVKRK